MRDECAGKTNQTLFIDQSRYKVCYYCYYFVFFQDYGTFFIYEGEEKLKLWLTISWNEFSVGHESLVFYLYQGS